MIGCRYTAANIHALEDWALAWLKERAVYHEDDREWSPPEGQTVDGIATWCRSWAENDPRDNGGDGTWRRDNRKDWPAVHADYRQIERR